MLSGLKAVVVGYGNIGRRVAKVLKALGMEVLGVKRSAKPPAMVAARTANGGGVVTSETRIISQDADAEDGTALFPPAAIHALLPTASVVLLALPDTDETAGIMGAAQFALLPSPCCVVNLGRASACDEASLWEWLKPDQGSCYGGDVWWQELKMGQFHNPDGVNEPIRVTTDPSRQFESLRNVVMTPHCT